jgi:hypothetical protein
MFSSALAGSMFEGFYLILAGSGELGKFISCGTCQSKIVTFGRLSGKF